MEERMKKLIILFISITILLVGCGKSSEENYIEKTMQLIEEAVNIQKNIDEIISYLELGIETSNDINHIKMQSDNYIKEIEKVNPPAKFERQHEQLYEQLLLGAETLDHFIDNYLTRLSKNMNEEEVLEISVGSLLFLKKAQQHYDNAFTIMDDLLVELEGE